MSNTKDRFGGLFFPQVNLIEYFFVIFANDSLTIKIKYYGKNHIRIRRKKRDC